MQYDKYLVFDSRYVDQILNRNKRKTVRYGLKRTFKVGETVSLIDDTREEFATATVAGVQEMTPSSFIGSDPEYYPIDSLDELIERMNEHYVPRIKEGTEVTVISYDVHLPSAECPECDSTHIERRKYGLWCYDCEEYVLRAHA